DAAVRRLRISREDLRTGLEAAQNRVSSFLSLPRLGVLEPGAGGAAAVGLAQLKASRGRLLLRNSRQGPELPSTAVHGPTVEAEPDISQREGQHLPGTAEGGTLEQPLPSRLLQARRKNRD